MPRLFEFFVVALACFLVSTLLTWLVRNQAIRREWLALPRLDRWHREPTALFGGVAIYAVLTVGLLATRPISRTLVGLLLLSAVMFTTGLIDDIRHLRPQAKLVVQLVCGLLLYSFGYHFNEAFPWWADLFIVVFWVVAVTNAVNLLDNMNGLAAGIAVIAAVFRFMFYRETGNVDGATTTVVFAGAVAGFLVFNYPRASIFMGDAGSFTIGFTLAALNLSSAEAYTKSVFSVLFFPVLLLAIPILDTAFVSVVRHFSGRAISQGGRDHMSHRLVAVGLSETQAVLALWGISALSGGVASVLYKVGFSYAWFGAALMALAFLLFSIVLGRVRVYDEEDVDRSETRSRPSFLLLSEFPYKRQVLWVFVDASTVVLSMYGACLILFGGGADWAREAARFARIAPIAVASTLIGVLANGLYRSDQQNLSAPEWWLIVRGTTVGFGITTAVALLGLSANGDPLGTLVISWLATIGSMAATRLFVNRFESLLKARAAAQVEKPSLPGRYDNEPPDGHLIVNKEEQTVV
jgi:UDP-GlcNAc:undecaprenyl-phosphate GlcNAc-1-phosphate transferase